MNHLKIKCKIRMIRVDLKSMILVKKIHGELLQPWVYFVDYKVKNTVLKSTVLKTTLF